MQFFKKVLIVIVSLALLLVIINVSITYWLSRKIPSILQSEKISYNVSYNDLDIRLLSGSFTIKNAYLAPKDTTAGKPGLSKGVYGKIKEIEIDHFNLWALLWDDEVDVENVIIDTPDIVLYQKDQKNTARDEFLQSMKKSIITQKIQIKNGKFRMLDTLQRIAFKADNIDFKIKNTTLDSASVTKNVPVRYGNYTFSCDSLLYRISDFYTLTAKKITNSNTTLNAVNFKMLPHHSRVEFNKVIPVERDQFTIAADTIAIPKADWGFTNDTLFVHIPSVTLNALNANIYRGKMVKDDTTTKKLYSQLLRELDFDLKVDTLLLKSARITYEEQLEYERPPGKVIFSQFYASIYNIYSPVGKQKLPDTKIDVKCRFMESAPLQVQWSFNTANTNDDFTLSANLGDLNLEKVNKVMKPLMNVSAEGNIEKLYFTMNGNRENASGNFGINYNSLKIDVHKKDGKGTKGLLSFAGNLVVKNNSNDKTKEVDITAKRAKDKSVFNFVFRFVNKGLKTTLLPKILTGGEDD